MRPGIAGSFCRSRGRRSPMRGATLTASVLDNIGGTVMTVGDNAYPDGSSTAFTTCYDPTWGRHKLRTRPIPGNHDYETSGASGYFNYFGALAGPSGTGYYSYDLGTWHIIALNSELDVSGAPRRCSGCAPISPPIRRVAPSRIGTSPDSSPGRSSPATQRIRRCGTPYTSMAPTSW